ncbi:hypothetical protein AcV7_002358 [Taiwanofungus camphoratus]|nr:hypothetical protein AcV7_002358 [Antrodia cinnamomea]
MGLCYHVTMGPCLLPTRQLFVNFILAQLYFLMSSISETPHLLPFPPVARKGIPWLNRIRGLFHRWILVKFSIRYCKFFNVPREDCIFPLPFNTLLKWTEGTREEEALAMISARAIGLPVPRMLSYGDHGPGEDGSILMTRVPGQTLNTVLYTLSAAQRETISAELDGLLRRMRMFANPAGTRVSTVDGGGDSEPARASPACRAVC